ncbi:MAG: Lrp/AsnC family transcriptional regulator [Halobacteria archaeon]
MGPRAPPRTRPPKFDRVDWAILRRLARDGRATFHDMARETGVSTSTVMNRVRRLSSSGVIERFTLVVNPESVNRSMTAFLAIRVRPERKNAVVERLREMAPVLEIYELLEPYDLLAKVRTDSVPSLKEAVLRVLSGLDGVLDATTFLTTRRHKEVPCHLD